MFWSWSWQPRGQGNYVGMTEAEMDAADPKELAAKVAKATDILYKVGFQRWANLNGWIGDYNKWKCWLPCSNSILVFSALDLTADIDVKSLSCHLFEHLCNLIEFENIAVPLDLTATWTTYNLRREPTLWSPPPSTCLQSYWCWYWCFFSLVLVAIAIVAMC